MKVNTGYLPGNSHMPQYRSYICTLARSHWHEVDGRCWGHLQLPLLCSEVMGGVWIWRSGGQRIWWCGSVPVFSLPPNTRLRDQGCHLRILEVNKIVIRWTNRGARLYYFYLDVIPQWPLRRRQMIGEALETPTANIYLPDRSPVGYKVNFCPRGRQICPLPFQPSSPSALDHLCPLVFGLVYGNCRVRNGVLQKYPRSLKQWTDMLRWAIRVLVRTTMLRTHWMPFWSSWQTWCVLRSIWIWICQQLIFSIG